MQARGLISLQQLEALASEAGEARIRLARARLDLSRTIALAPMAGLVAECKARVGDLASPRTLLFRIICPRDLKAEVFVPGNRLDGVRTGQAVTACPAGLPDLTVSGRIVRISLVVDPESGTCRAVAFFPNAGKRIRPGTLAHITFTNPKGDP